MLHNYYSILGIAPQATQDEIKKAFRSKAKLFHPDVNNSPRSGELFILLNEAYEVLVDEHKRFLYDLKLKYKVPSQNPAQDPRKYGTTAQYKNPVTEAQSQRKYRANYSSDKPVAPAYMVSLLYLFGMFVGFTIVMVTLRAIYLHYWPTIFIFICLPGLVLIKEAWTGINGKGSWIKMLYNKAKNYMKGARSKA